MIWQRSKIRRLCGFCSASIDVGEPVLQVTAAYLSRCVACAKRNYQTEPPKLEPLPMVKAPASQPFAPVRDLVKRFDVKLAQTGEGR